MIVTAKRLAARARLARVAVARQKSVSRVTPRDRRGTREPVASGETADQVLARVRRETPNNGGNPEVRAHKISRLFAAELRRLGMLAAEGYALGSWAAR